MEFGVLDAALQAGLIIFTPERLIFLCMGVLLGLSVGIIPGLGGFVGLSLLLPFTFGMDPFTALAFMLGLAAVTTTSDTIPAVLFGVPGTTGSQATILDGHPLAKEGQAGRALGAAFAASLLGGVFGALVLAVSVPILRPILLFIGTPELLMFCVFGLSLAAVLSGGAALKGLAGACLGLLIASVGEDPGTGTMRWTFGTIYLWQGIPLVAIALGLFAVPELADIAIKRTVVVRAEGGIQRLRRGDQWQGVKDVLNNKWLVVRCATIGVGLAAVPGIGASVIDWIAYGHAARSEKGAKETFGRGDIRGVIAPESANNAKEGGALVPTVAFGVPGTPAMAIFIGFFLIMGIIPGPQMLTTRLDVTYSLVWSVALANVVGAGICFLFANQLAKIITIRTSLLVPLILAVVYIGVFRGSQDWGDLHVMIVFGVIGWLMKRLGWPRPPVILGVVLGPLVERYLFISVQAFGPGGWITRPVVIFMLLVTLYGLMVPLIRIYRARRRDGGSLTGGLRFGLRSGALSGDVLAGFAIAGLFAYAIAVSWNWPLMARLVPQVSGWFGLGCAVFFLARALFVTSAAPAGKTQIMDIGTDFGDLLSIDIARRAAGYFLSIALYILAAHVIGMLPAIFFFVLAYMVLYGGEKWLTSLIAAALMTGFSWFLFQEILHVPWPEALIGRHFPVLRTYAPLF